MCALWKMRKSLSDGSQSCGRQQQSGMYPLWKMQTGMPGTGNQVRITKAVIIKSIVKAPAYAQCHLEKDDIWLMPALFNSQKSRPLPEQQYRNRSILFQPYPVESHMLFHGTCTVYRDDSRSEPDRYPHMP